MGSWSPYGVRERRQVARDVRATSNQARVGRVYGVCVEANHELPTERPGRTFTGRLVFLGSEVQGERAHYSICQEFSSDPATFRSVKSRR